MNKPKGYTKKYKSYILKEVTEDLAVHCNRCNFTWKESITHHGVFAGYARYYDMCSKCITPEEQERFNEKS